MAGSSINFAKAKSHSHAHNFRQDKPSYLLPENFAQQNEFWQNELGLTAKQIFDNEVSKSSPRGGRKPKFENSHWEAVLNCEQKHSMADIRLVAEHIEKKFNIKCVEIALHKDEGAIIDGQPKHNYHAHLNFVTYKDGRQNWRGEYIKPAELSRLQTDVAGIMGMKRGGVSVLEEATRLKKTISAPKKRLEHREYKQAIRTSESAKNPETDFYDFRAMQKKITALETENSELKKELHKLNTAANKTKELETIKALEAKIQELQISSERITEQKIQKLEFESEIMSVINQARHEEMRASFAEPPSAYEAFNELTKGKDSLDKKEIEKIKQELKAHDRKVKDFAKKIIDGFKSTKTALFSILVKITGKDIDNQIKLKIEGKESEIEAYKESQEVKNEEIQETTLKAFVEEQEAKIHAHTPSKLG